jgi:hypothetical protein
MLGGLGDGSRVAVATFPISWRIEMADERDDREHDYVR